MNFFNPTDHTIMNRKEYVIDLNIYTVYTALNFNTNSSQVQAIIFGDGPGIALQVFHGAPCDESILKHQLSQSIRLLYNTVLIIYYFPQYSLDSMFWENL